MNNLTTYENYHLNESVESGPMGFVISFNAGGHTCGDELHVGRCL